MREILVAGGLALFVSLFGTPILIRFLAQRGYGQIIRDDGPQSHHTKRGTPTMGGLIIIAAAMFGYFFSHALTQVAVSASAILVIGLVCSLGFVGFLDDWLKVSRQRSLGLTGWQKIFGQGALAAIFAGLGIHFADQDGFMLPIKESVSLKFSAANATFRSCKKTARPLRALAVFHAAGAAGFTSCR